MPNKAQAAKAALTKPIPLHFDNSIISNTLLVCNKVRRLLLARRFPRTITTAAAHSTITTVTVTV